MNKKGGFDFLGEKTLNILIALICLIFLAFLLVSLYSGINRSTKAEQADTLLNKKNGIIAAIKSGESYADFPVSSPAGWYIFGFTLLAPDSCAGQKCICVCEKAGSFLDADIQKTQLKKCDDKGACAVVSDLKEQFEIQIESVTSISITQTEGAVEIKKN